MLASDKGHHEVVHLLVNAGANKDIQDIKVNHVAIITFHLSYNNIING